MDARGSVLHPRRYDSPGLFSVFNCSLDPWVAALEVPHARPVLTVNQVSFWNALRYAGVHAPVVHYGRIFAEQLPAN
jgi:maleate cis-trans isomerase